MAETMGGDSSSQSATTAEAERLKDYYDRTATKARWIFYILTMLRVTLTASIPVVALAAPQKSNPALFGSLGAVVLVIEAMLAMVEPGKKWKRYRAADMAIQSELRLYRAKGKHYAVAGEPNKVLAERLDTIATAEHDDWQSIQDRITESKKTSRPDHT